MAGLDKFQEVHLDFVGVADIGQAFSDEVFRVYPLAHPTARLTVVNACERVRNMIGHVGFNPSQVWML